MAQPFAGAFTPIKSFTAPYNSASPFTLTKSVPGGGTVRIVSSPTASPNTGVVTLAINATHNSAACLPKGQCGVGIETGGFVFHFTVGATRTYYLGANWTTSFSGHVSCQGCFPHGGAEVQAGPVLKVRDLTNGTLVRFSTGWVWNNSQVRNGSATATGTDISSMAMGVNLVRGHSYLAYVLFEAIVTVGRTSASGLSAAEFDLSGSYGAKLTSVWIA